MEKVKFTPGEKQETRETKEPEEPKELPPVDFVSFILSLAASAQVHLGLIPTPGGEKAEKNAGLAKQTIDVLGVLQEKTKGNLTAEEEKILTEILHTLRLQYVEAKK